jgi:hypothetical protein
MKARFEVPEVLDEVEIATASVSEYDEALDRYGFLKDAEPAVRTGLPACEAHRGSGIKTAAAG